MADLKKEDKLTNVVSYWDTDSPDLRSRDGREAMVLAHVTGDETEQRENAQRILDTYTGSDKGALTVEAGGGAAVGSDLSTQVIDDLVLAEIIAIPLTLVLLLFVFGSVVAALLPLAIAIIAVIGSFAQLSLLGSVTEVADTATNLTTALGLGLGIDYALLMTSRFREQLAAGASVDDAVRRTVSTAGRTVAFSAATVAAALASLLVFPQYFLRSFGFAGVGVVAIAALATLFVMPSLLAVLGHRVNSGRLPWAKRGRSGAREPLWGRLARTVMRRPVLTALPVLACVAFGLSMDYEVFVTSRIKELHDLGADNETAVADGLGHTGRIVSAAAFVLAVSFFAFGTAKISFMQMFGLGSGLAILIDALAVRGVLVPAAMRLLGRSAWYAPGFLRGLHDRIGLSEGGPEPTAAKEPAMAK